MIAVTEEKKKEMEQQWNEGGEAITDGFLRVIKEATVGKRLKNSTVLASAFAALCYLAEKDHNFKVQLVFIARSIMNRYHKDVQK